MVTETVELPQEDEYVIRFHAEWCAPCKGFQPVYEDAAVETIIPFYDVNIEEAMELAREFKVMSIPAAFWVNGDTRKSLQITSSPSEFIKQLES